MSVQAVDESKGNENVYLKKPKKNKTFTFKEPFPQQKLFLPCSAQTFEYKNQEKLCVKVSNFPSPNRAHDLNNL